MLSRAAENAVAGHTRPAGLYLNHTDLNHRAEKTYERVSGVTCGLNQGRGKLSWRGPFGHHLGMQ